MIMKLASACVFKKEILKEHALVSDVLGRHSV